eukprot:GHVS01086393.1.p1 GENE.GHVS01086393.1~~GHVS01086393.1.p1  ORF type:complete len:523 (+),score=62.53 GHVS01086393.1:172-1569(+)
MAENGSAVAQPQTANVPVSSSSSSCAATTSPNPNYIAAAISSSSPIFADDGDISPPTSSPIPNASPCFDESTADEPSALVCGNGGVRHRAALSRHGSGGQGGLSTREASLSKPTSVAILDPSSERPLVHMSRRQRYLHDFTQQKMRAWQPVLTPRWVITSFMIFGIVFLGIGIGLLVTSNSVIECQVQYEDPSSITSPTTTSVTITKDDCVGINQVNPVIASSNLNMYYALTNFYQNHRRYVNSMSPAQLSGTVYTSSSSLSVCDPIVIAEDGVRVRSPCGLAAWAVFNDTLTLYSRKDLSNSSLDDSNLRPVSVDEDAKTISWYSDWKYKYKNPDPTEEQAEKIDQWLDEDIFPGKVENGHFMVWMRNAALPNFRKLYCRIDEPQLELPLTVKIINRFPVKSMKGTKSVVVSTASWYGGRNPFLGIFYLVVGSVCILLSALFTFRNRKSPRILGDIRHLQWTGG